MRIALNIAAFYAGWFASVLAAASGYFWPAVASSLAVVAVHLAIAPRPISELKLVMAVAAIGLVAEAALIAGGFARYAVSPQNAILPPLWLIAIWMAFATTLNVSLSWLKERMVLAAALGFAVAPLSYYAGERLGGMALSDPQLVSLGAIGAVWMAAFPAVLMLARLLNGVTDH